MERKEDFVTIGKYTPVLDRSPVLPFGAGLLIKYKVCSLRLFVDDPHFLLLVHCCKKWLQNDCFHLFYILPWSKQIWWDLGKSPFWKTTPNMHIVHVANDHFLSQGLHKTDKIWTFTQTVSWKTESEYKQF